MEVDEVAAAQIRERHPHEYAERLRQNRQYSMKKQSALLERRRRDPPVTLPVILNYPDVQARSASPFHAYFWHSAEQ